MIKVVLCLLQKTHLTEFGSSGDQVMGAHIHAHLNRNFSSYKLIRSQTSEVPVSTMGGGEATRF